LFRFIQYSLFIALVSVVSVVSVVCLACLFSGHLYAPGDDLDRWLREAYEEAAVRVYMDLRPVGVERQGDTVLSEDDLTTSVDARLAEDLDQIKQKAFRYMDGAPLGDGILSSKGGRVADQCDSMLFTGLAAHSRFLIAGGGWLKPHEDRRLTLKTAGAVKAWSTTALSPEDGHPARHALCASQALSRDMAMGLALAATSLEAAQARHPFLEGGGLRALASSLRGAMAKSILAGGGIFLSPLSRSGLASSVVNPTVLAMLFPDTLAPVFLANDAVLIMGEPRGFVSHLNAVTLLYEMESWRAHRQPTTLVDHPINRLARSEDAREAARLRRFAMIADELYRIDNQNLLFKTLRYHALLSWAAYRGFRELAVGADGLTPQTIDQIKRVFAADVAGGLRRLEARSLFPDSLPTSAAGGRDQEYLWQRTSASWVTDAPPGQNVVHVWPGVDYTLIAGLIAVMLD
jgi:hypothetical protein